MEHLIVNFLASLRIEGRNRIVHDDNVRTFVDSPCQTYSSLLAAGQIDTFLTNLSQITRRQKRKVCLKLASKDGLNVPALIELRAKADIVPELAILNPMLTLDETHRACDAHGTLTLREVLQ